MLNDEEQVLPTSHERIKIAKVREYNFDKVEQDILSLIEIAKSYDAAKTVKTLKSIVPEYVPQNPEYKNLCQS